MPAISKITAKGQTTVPQEIRKALKSKPGDLIAWEIEPSGRVAVRRIQPLDVEYLQAVLGQRNERRDGEERKADGEPLAPRRREAGASLPRACSGKKTAGALRHPRLGL